ncbi:hypothetical protein [Bifidobacterium sp.]|jgi:predicted RNase H-like nuclease (RuvC/YqgF family)|uniref:hypothetical protein n=1 Tax=Bifidobacterium sp. TaxID=41200 RepID=UPI0025C246F0|nr:hypothetical protein [Bifidobacterium sp.]MCH4209729.1 hypothetical protein [Bifidobacterium sp.]MCI1224501.1 hypothetical protein [Bifidobacterium sp.]
MSEITEANETEGQTAEPQPETIETTKGTSREAKYRNRAKQAEQQAERLSALLTEARKTILSSALKDLNQQAAQDLLNGMEGEQVASFFDDDGQLSANHINEYTDELLKAKPYMRADDAESKLKKIETDRQLSEWKAQVSDETEVPAEVLVGSSLEELRAFAKKLRKNADRIHPYGLKIPGIGDVPMHEARTNRWDGTFR